MFKYLTTIALALLLSTSVAAPATEPKKEQMDDRPDITLVRRDVEVKRYKTVLKQNISDMWPDANKKGNAPNVIIGLPTKKPGVVIPKDYTNKPAPEAPVKPVPPVEVEKPTIPKDPIVPPTVPEKPAPEKPVEPKPEKPTPPIESETAPETYQLDMINSINKERLNNGLSPLILDMRASTAAAIKSQDMVDYNYFAHSSPRLGRAGDILKSVGISWSRWGENIAKGQTSVSQVMSGWMNSEGHRKNILSNNFKYVGLGRVRNSNGQFYWTQIFYK